MLVRLMRARTQSTSPVVPDLNHLVVLLGRYFQIRDDYMNLTSLEVSSKVLVPFDIFLKKAGGTD